MGQLFTNETTKNDFLDYYENRLASTIFYFVDIMHDFRAIRKLEDQKENIEDFITEYNAKDAPDKKSKMEGKEYLLEVNKFLSFVYILPQITSISFLLPSVKSLGVTADTITKMTEVVESADFIPKTYYAEFEGNMRAHLANKYQTMQTNLQKMVININKKKKEKLA